MKKLKKILAIIILIIGVSLVAWGIYWTINGTLSALYMAVLGAALIVSSLVLYSQKSIKKFFNELLDIMPF